MGRLCLASTLRTPFIRTPQWLFCGYFNQFGCVGPRGYHKNATTTQFGLSGAPPWPRPTFNHHFGRPFQLIATQHIQSFCTNTPKGRSMEGAELEKRRAAYRCGNKYVTLDEVPTWPTFYKMFRGEIDRLARGCTPKAEVDESLASKVSLWRGDITHLEIDAIVNAANKSLLGGGGVDGAIHSAAGNNLYLECKTLGGCNTGEAKITQGYKLPSKHVIHTVGPNLSRGSTPSEVDQKKLRDCYENSLNLVSTHKLRTVAFPCISTGLYSYPNEDAAAVAVETVRHWLKENAGKVDRVIFCVFLPIDVEVYEKRLALHFPLVGGSMELPLELRRAAYKCGSNFATVENIPTWPDFYKQNREEIDSAVRGKEPEEAEDESYASKISLWRGNITHLEIDAIVNPAKESLSGPIGRNGVDGHIHWAAGDALNVECAMLRGCRTGEAKITGGHNLPSKHVIHTVGPRLPKNRTTPTEEEKYNLRQCYENSLKLVSLHNLRTVAFPCISTGNNHYPSEDAAEVALTTVKHWLKKNGRNVNRVIFSIFQQADVEVYQKKLALMFPVTE